jgi:hypothetical protein
MGTRLIIARPISISIPITIRADTPKIKPGPSPLHLIARGVVDQIKMTARNPIDNLNVPGPLVAGMFLLHVI